MGEEFHTLYGPGWIEDTLCGLTFRLSPRSFYQVNHEQAQRLYALAIAAGEIGPEDTVLDLYCGVGTFTLAMARAAGRVIGVEVEPQAVADAQANARRNGVTNVEFLCGDAGQAAQTLAQRGLTPGCGGGGPAQEGAEPAGDPGGGGHEPPAAGVCVLRPCHPWPGTLPLLKNQGLCPPQRQAVDMFPRCAHVETVVLLSKGEIDSKKVRVEFSLEGMDMSWVPEGRDL